MDEPRHDHTKWSKPDKCYNIWYDLYVENNTNESIYKTEMDLQIYGYQRGEEGEKGQIRGMGLIDTNCYT